VPAAQAEAYRTAQPKATREIVTVPEIGHFELVAPWSPAFTAVRSAVRTTLGLP
jgi:hypothetical protein